MKRPVILLLLILFAFACKDKNDPEPAEATPEPTPPANTKGNLTFYVSAFDSLGGAQLDASGIQVVLTQNGQSAVTASNGAVTFTDLPYDTYTPVLLKSGYEGPPISVKLESPARSVSLPLARRSNFRINGFSGTVLSQDTIILTFNFDQAVPAGKFCRVAIFTSTVLPLNPNNYGALDIVGCASKINSINIAYLPEFRDYMDLLAPQTKFYISAVAVSYGLYKSDLNPKPVLLGDNLFNTDNLNLYKTW